MFFTCRSIVALLMIVTSNLQWMHLPKTAGTTTEKLFLASGLPLLWNDPQSSPLKHLPLSEHPNFSSIPLHDQLRVANFRRLPDWLLSNFQHKRRMMNLDLNIEPMRRGLFWRERDHSWFPADWWLDRLQIDENCLLLRVDYLKSDFLKCLNQYDPIGPISRLRVRLVKDQNRNTYQRSLREWYTCDDLSCLYSENPQWAALEQLVYGSLLLDL